MHTALSPHRAAWITSSYSGSQGNCVEVAHLPLGAHKLSYSTEQTVGVEAPQLSTQFHQSSYPQSEATSVESGESGMSAAIRDTKHRDLGALAFPSTEWRAFLSALKDDDL